MTQKLTKTELRMRKFAQLHAATNFKSATQAAIDAGYAKKSAPSTGSMLIRNPKVMGYLAELAEKALVPLEIKQDDILRRLKSIAFANVADAIEFVEIDGVYVMQIKRLDKLPKEISCAIAEIKIANERVIYQGGMKVTTQVITLKFKDQLKALDSLAKWSGLYKEAVPDEILEFFAGLQIITPGAKVLAKRGQKRLSN